jgi:predicted RNA-binding protein with PUA-like domain
MRSLGRKSNGGVFLHSLDLLAPVGVAEAVRESYPDPTAEAGSPWVVVDVKAVTPLTTPVPLAAIKEDPKLKDMALVKQSRLSVQPVTAAEWKRVCDLGGVKG